MKVSRTADFDTSSVKLTLDKIYTLHTPPDLSERLWTNNILSNDILSDFPAVEAEKVISDSNQTKTAISPK